MTLLAAWSLLGFLVAAFGFWRWRRADREGEHVLFAPFVVGLLWLGVMLGLYAAELLPRRIW